MKRETLKDLVRWYLLTMAVIWLWLAGSCAWDLVTVAAWPRTPEIGQGGTIKALCVAMVFGLSAAGLFWILIRQEGRDGR